MTHFPTRMWNGKNQGWYFVARITSNKNFGDAGVGDRLLVTYQGQGVYQTGTEGNARNTPAPDDIEGLWTYHYFSFNKSVKKSVAFFMFGDAKPTT